MTLNTAQEPVYCYVLEYSNAVMKFLWLQMQVANLRSNIYSAIRICCVTMTWQHIFKRFTSSYGATL